MITVGEVAERVREIEAILDDKETAHAKQDNLYFDVLTAIAEGAEYATRLAQEAIKASELGLDRWYS